jgi:hypothetical protein
MLKIVLHLVLYIYIYESIPLRGCNDNNKKKFKFHPINREN